MPTQAPNAWAGSDELRSSQETVHEALESKCDYVLSDLKGQVICVDGQEASEFKNEPAKVLTIRRDPKSKPETCFSTSKVFNEGIDKLAAKGNPPWVVRVSAVKRYIRADPVQE